MDMKRLFNILTRVAPFILLFLSCNKDITKTSQPEYFPNTIGDFWQYQVTDSSQSSPNNPSAPIRYSVSVNITGIKTLLDGKDATIWQYQYPWGNDTNYVRVTGDTIKIFDLTYSRSLSDLNYPRLVFLPPFQVNQSWDGNLLDIDSYTVIHQADINTGSQTFMGCYDINYQYSGPNMEVNDHYWFKPFVGMVSMYSNHYLNGPNTYRTWQLTRYYTQ